MNMLISELQALAADPWSWAVVALMAAFAIQSVGVLMMCPYVHGRAEITDAEVAAARDDGINPGPRFAMLMLAGVALVLAGLFMIAGGTAPKIALAALVVGIVLIQTEPARLLIRHHKTRVIAHRDAAPEVREGERDRLRSSHFQLAGTNVVIALGLAAGLSGF